MATKKNTVVKSKHDPRKTKFTFDEVTGELTERQKLFAMEYVRNKFNGTKAAISAGYVENSAAEQANRLLTNDNIQKFIGELKRDLSRCIGISAIDIAREYARIGFSDIRQIFDENGNLINIQNIADDPAANISSIEVHELYAGETNIGQVKKIKLYDKVNALDKLARMIGADGVTKVANTNKDGDDAPPPLSDAKVEEILRRISK